MSAMKKSVLAWSRCALLVAGAAASFSAMANKANDTLVYASDSEVENISQYHNNLREGVILAHLIWDTLVYRDPKTNEYKPQLATAWKWESPTALVLDLRQGVLFQNGDKFSADDVVFTFNYVVAPDSKAVTRQNTDWIKSVDKLGDYKVRINMKAPFPAALEYLAGPLPIYPGAYFKKVGLEAFSKAPIGTGPYKVTSVTPGQGVTLVKNAGYFKESPQGQPSIGNIKFMVIPDPETRAAQLMTGAVDWIWRVPPDQADSLKSNPKLAVQSGETMRVGFVTLDATGSSSANSPFKDLRVRQAVNYAINRKGIAENLMRGGSQPVYTACFRTQFGCDTNAAIKYDYSVAKAKELLAAAGYANGFDTDIYAYREREVAEAIIGDLHKVGIRARLHYLKFAALQNEYRSGKTPMTFQAWGSFSMNDTSAFAGVFFKGSADDITKDPQLQQLVQAGDTSTDPAVRKTSYSKALEMISKQAYMAPMFSYSTYYAFNAQLKFQGYPDELPRFYEASWK
ncbi:ABC transporter substrate-binding protein [Herbaspirillum sp. alder98]|uniref:ABC transporter substrate-binding protein n=1 Tax=Herbaspirillum sp. alder98 TaxID=2913096 RepID=UPI001CD8F1F3|nr:ABC transporter substrate-binding protein [Herbaspirillum sp. alder98]MCA1323023.1 ABC transporter substrate-binding protein [Herbaspirillum sp. alder98]